MDNQLKILLKHRIRIKQKLFLRKLYTDFYLDFAHTKHPQGLKVELGSGAGFIKNVIPGVVTSDVNSGPGIDRIFSVERMPFPNDSVAVFYMLDVFHHLKNAKMALVEMSRCLKSGGKIVMIEPYASKWGKVIYKNFHYEKYTETKSWKVTGTDPLADSNLALPWMVFVRDQGLFKQLFRQLKINYIKPHTPIRYLISGGLTPWQFLPSLSYPLVVWVEHLLLPLNQYIGMFVTIELEKLKTIR